MSNGIPKFSIVEGNSFTNTLMTGNGKIMTNA